LQRTDIIIQKRARLSRGILQKHKTGRHTKKAGTRCVFLALLCHIKKS
jgi:hypothetical protein